MGLGTQFVMTRTAGLLLPLLAALAFAAPALAQNDSSLAQSGQPPQRTSVLYTYGNDPCPEPVGDEIVVCAQQPESERYRVPKELREELKDDTPVGGGSWASAVAISSARLPSSISFSASLAASARAAAIALAATA